MTDRETVQKQFGPAAEDYVNCPVQSGDFTLNRLLELVKPQPNWEVLDVATGGGHTSILLAPHVSNVRAIDLTDEMLIAAERNARKHGLDNITFEQGDAVELPYPDKRYDLVVSRVAAHHFADVQKFLSESRRVLRDGGVLAVVDSHLPDGPAGEYINGLQRIHDPSHVRCLSAEEWMQRIESAGFLLRHKEEGRVEIEFNNWTKRARVSPENTEILREKFLQAPNEADAILNTRIENGHMYFNFQRLILIADAKESPRV